MVWLDPLGHLLVWAGEDPLALFWMGMALGPILAAIFVLVTGRERHTEEN